MIQQQSDNNHFLQQLWRSSVLRSSFVSKLARAVRNERDDAHRRDRFPVAPGGGYRGDTWVRRAPRPAGAVS